jgi:phosphinothricin acetyltransferase
VVVREASPADVPAVTALQNALLAATTTEWRDTPHTVAERARWVRDHAAAGRPVLVAEVDGAVAGFAAWGDFRDTARWPGYRPTVEHTVHVAEAHWGTGVGRALVEEVVARATAEGAHVVVAAVDGANEGSIRFHRRLGFVEVGRLPEVGAKHGRWLDLVLLQRTLTPGAPPPAP